MKKYTLPELEAENEKLRSLLTETRDWLCVHDESAIKAQREGLRGWCTGCQMYLRCESDTNLVERIDAVLDGAKE